MPIFSGDEETKEANEQNQEGQNLGQNQAQNQINPQLNNQPNVDPAIIEIVDEVFGNPEVTEILDNIGNNPAIDEIAAEDLNLFNINPPPANGNNFPRLALRNQSAPSEETKTIEPDRDLFEPNPVATPMNNARNLANHNNNHRNPTT